MSKAQAALLLAVGVLIVAPLVGVGCAWLWGRVFDQDGDR